MLFYVYFHKAEGKYVNKTQIIITIKLIITYKIIKYDELYSIYYSKTNLGIRTNLTILLDELLSLLYRNSPRNFTRK